MIFVQVLTLRIGGCLPLLRSTDVVFFAVIYCLVNVTCLSFLLANKKEKKIVYIM